MKRPNWKVPKDENGKLDLSKNEFYDPCYSDYINDLLINIDVTKYPNEYKAYKSISKLYNIPIKNLAIGFGADEIIGRCSQLFNFIILNDDQYEMTYVYNKINWNTNKRNVLYFGNPSNKSTTIIPKDGLISILNNSKLIIILDEVYLGFCGYNNSLRFEIENYPNLIIIDSASKNMGLPGLRCGFAIACEELILEIQNIRPSHICNTTVQILDQISINSINNFRQNIMDGKNYIERHFKHIKCNNIPYSILKEKPLKDKILTRRLHSGYRVGGTTVEVLKNLGL